MSIRENIQKIRKIAGDAVKIVAVTKGRSADEIKEAIGAGITDIGENRLQETKGKLKELPKNITRHFIGRLQTNKVREAVSVFDMIQSVDNIKLAQKISAECGKINKIMPILIQVNTSNEPQKGGVQPNCVIPLIYDIAGLPNIKVRGLMTIAVQSDNQGEVRKCFKALKKLFDAITKKAIPNAKMCWLSMGMSEDYKVAIEEGANIIRIGRGIFQA